MSESGYTVAALARESGHPKSLINKKIWMGQIPLHDGLVSVTAATRILYEKKKFISLQEYASLHTSERFSGKSDDREKLRFYLEENDFFGLFHAGVEEILMGIETDGVYLVREDVPLLDQHLEDFFDAYGLTGKESVNRILIGAERTCPETVKLLRAFIKARFYNWDEYPPSVVTFVRVMTGVPDIRDLENDDIKTLLQKELSFTSKEFIVRFLTTCRGKVPVKYAEVVVKEKPRHSVPSYSSDIYFGLMRCVFNADYIHEHEMVEKALSNHMYAEAWLYIACFVVCGWRASDVCRGWKYLRLHEREDTPFGIDKATLHDDLLHDRIQDSVYEEVCRYCLSSVDVAGQLPRKTSLMDPPPLKAMIRPELTTFFGMLTLIAESHALRTGDGYMKPIRISVYQSRVTLKAFFGQEICDVLGNENLQSRRLNKFFLQGVEDAARKNGNSGMMAAMVAGYARNHTSMDTIKHYLRDHNMSGETAEVVLYFMMERGIFGFLYYQTLCMAYPEAVKKLPMKKQNELIAIIDEKPLDLELKQAMLVEQYHIREQFRQGKKEVVERVMLDMLEISQGRGKAKDDGLYCLKRARGEACLHPEYASCLAGCCPLMVFTQAALIPLVEVLRSCMEKAEHDLKAQAVLEKVMVPFYQDILNSVMRKTYMTREDRLGIKKIIEEVLHG